MREMSGRQNERVASDFRADCARVFHEWHERARVRDTQGLLALYSEDAILESPLVPAILDDKQDGVLRGRDELRRFFEEGGRRRPNELVRWYRTGEWLTDGHRLLVWEYPRQAPDGDQVDLVEFMEIAGGLVRCHRIYWGCSPSALAPRVSVRSAAVKVAPDELRARLDEAVQNPCCRASI